ncbi:MAG: hypothetical protein U1F66_01890 [bacterium]
MKRNLAKLFFILLSLGALGACKGTPPQVSGVVAIANFETTACVPQEKTLQIRNNNTDEPQRVQGVLFELGTNDFDKEGNHPDTLKEGEKYFQFFKVEQVAVGNVVKEAVKNMVTEIVLPPGGVMTVKVAYNPKVVTKGDAYHNTYLDVILNGPKLGVMQIELRGKAPTAQAGCTTDGGAGDGQEFEVTAVKTTLSHKDNGSNVVTDLDVNDAVTGTLILSKGSADGKVKILTENWPAIKFPLPAGSPLAEMEIKLAEDTGEADFGDDGKLSFEGVAFSGSNVVNLTGLTLTTESLTIGSDKAPNVVGGSINFQGSPLNDQGEMTLVVAAPLTVPPVDTVAKVGGGVFGMEIHLKKK